MFETLSDRLNETFGKLNRKGRLTEPDVDAAMREVRRALLEADVNFKVVKDFVATVRERAVGQDVLRSLTPAQTVIGIVNEELITVLGADQVPLNAPLSPPQIILMVGLNGAGKTTHSGKLAVHLRKQGRNPLMVAADVYRPAAIAQLQTLGKQVNVPVYEEGTTSNPVDIARNAIAFATDRGFNPVIIDTAGRLQIDQALMQELVDIKQVVGPTEILLVADAMTGQEAVGVAEEFNAQLDVTGLVLTKMDGDARGGAALSIRSVTGVPIKFIGTGERPEAMEPFMPDRLASRILGLGDMLSLIERAQSAFDERQAEELERKMRTATFTLEDFYNQLQTIKSMGPLQQLVDMIPGMGSAMRGQDVQVDDREMKRIEAIIQSMTVAERQRPDLLKNGKRRKRIAAGSGTSVADVNALLSQFNQMQKMMKQLTSGKMPKIPGLFG